MTDHQRSKFNQYKWHKQLVRDGNLTPTERLVALALWDYYDPAKDQPVYPGRALLAEGLNLSKSTVDRSLKALREAGWVVRVRRGSSNGRRRLADEYRLAYPSRSSMKSTPDQSAPVTSDPAGNSQHRRVEQSSSTPRSVSMGDDPIDHGTNQEQPATPAPALTVIDGGNTKTSKPAGGFDAFCESYPKPISSSVRNEVLTLWRDAASKHGHRRLLKATQRYARTFSQGEVRYAKNPATWLRDGLFRGLMHE